MEYGDGRVFTRGTIFHIAWHVDGVEQRESTHQTDELVARARLREKVEAARCGRTLLSNKELTVETLCQGVIRDFKTQEQNVEDAVSNARIWRRALGAGTSLHRVLDRIPALIEDWQEAEEDAQGRPLDDGYSNATINRRLAFLQKGARLLKFLPLHDVAKPTKRGGFKLREDNVRDAYMNPVEFGRLYAAATRRDGDLADYFEWLYTAGFRRGEASLLEVPWVDTHRWVLTIPGRVQKHRKARVVHLDGPLRRMVQQRLARVQPQVPWLFHRDGAKIGEIRHLWPALCAEADLLERDGDELVARFRPHDLRRSAVTNLLHHMTPKEAMQITGHLTLSTFTRYQQCPEDQLRARLRSMPEPGWLPPASRAA